MAGPMITRRLVLAGALAAGFSVAGALPAWATGVADPRRGYRRRRVAGSPCAMPGRPGDRRAAAAGFSYLTLPGHPECGRETLTAEHDTDGVVWVSLAAVSRPGSILTAMAGPVGRLVQRRATARYADAVRAAAATGSAS